MLFDLNREASFKRYILIHILNSCFHNIMQNMHGISSYGENHIMPEKVMKVLD